MDTSAQNLAWAQDYYEAFLSFGMYVFTGNLLSPCFFWEGGLKFPPNLIIQELKKHHFPESFKYFILEHSVFFP